MSAIINGNIGVIFHEGKCYEVGSYQFLDVLRKINKIHYENDNKVECYTLWKNLKSKSWRGEKWINNQHRIIYLGISDRITLERLKQVGKLMAMNKLEYCRYKSQSNPPVL
jgi:hypothetical protein